MSRSSSATNDSTAKPRTPRLPEDVNENHVYLAGESDEHAHDWHEHDDEHDTLHRTLERSEQQTFAIDLRTLSRHDEAEAAQAECDQDVDLGW